MAFFVYILRCADGSYYTGHTDNIELRLAGHKSGEVPGYTQNKQPVSLVFVEEAPAREDALARERQIKGWTRAKKEALIARDWERLVALSANRAGTGEKPVRGELVSVKLMTRAAP